MKTQALAAPRGPADGVQNKAHLLGGQYDGQVFGSPSPHGVEPAQLQPEDLGIQKDQGVERLVL